MNKKEGKAKRILAILCAITLVVTLFPAGIFQNGAYAADEDATPIVESESTSDGQTEGSAAETSDTEKDESKEDTSDDNKEAEPGSITKPAGDETSEDTTSKDDEGNSDTSGKTETDGKETKDDEETVVTFEASFDLAENYGKFNPINPRNTDENGKLELPEKPEARVEEYESESGKTYYFTGWKLGEKEYEPGASVTLEKDEKVSAVWKQTYKIEFDTEGVQSESLDPMVGVFGESVELPSETSDKEGYDFIGWTPDNGTTLYKADTVIDAEKIQPDEEKAEVKLTAKIEDTTPPAVSLELEKLLKENKKLTGAQYKVSSEDKGTGVDTLEYVIQSDATVDEKATWTTIENEGTVDVTPLDEVQYLFVRSTDKAKNISDVKSVRVDKNELEAAPPVVELADGEEEKAEKIAKSHTIQFTAVDGPDGPDGPLNSGIDYIEVSGEGIETQTLDGDATEVTIGGEAINGTIEVCIKAVDNCGNSGEAYISCVFDNDAPAVEEVSMSDAANDYYYRADNAIVTIRVNDDSDIESVIVVTNETEVTAEESEGKYIADLSKLTDGDIIFSVRTKDSLGNEEEAAFLPEDAVSGVKRKSNTEAEFVLDTTAPVLNNVKTEESGINPLSAENYYYSKETTTTYEIEEKNVDTLALDYQKDGQAAETITKYEQNGTTVKVTGNWDNSGKYTDIALAVVDKAGNKLISSYAETGEDTVAATEDGVITFKYGKVVDTEAPKLVKVETTEKSGTFNSGSHLFDGKYYYNEKATTTYTVEDEHMASIELTYSKDGEAVAEPIRVEASEEDVNSLSLSVDWDEEAEYTDIKLTAYDAAGSSIMEVTPEDIEISRDEDSNMSVDDESVVFANGKVIDVTAPTYTSQNFSVVAEDTEAEDTEAYSVVGTTAYYQGKISGEFAVEETNFDESLMKAGLASDTDKDTKFSQMDPEWPDEIKGGTWDASEKKYTVEASEEGAYRFVIAGEDRAGNKLEKNKDDNKEVEYNKTAPNGEGTGQFWSYIKIVDMTDPEFTLTMKDTEEFYKLILRGSQGNSFYTYEPFRQSDTATISTETADRSPVRVKYSIRSVKASDGIGTDPVWTGHELIGADDFDEAEEANPEEVERKGEQQYEVYDVTVTDRSGRKTHADSTNIIYLDITKPVTGSDVVKPQASVIVKPATTAITMRGPNGQNIYSEAVKVEMKATDPNANKSSSGLKSATYTVYVDGEIVDGPNQLEKLTDAEKKKDLGVNDKLQYAVSKTIPINYESNNIRVEVVAEDNAGNKTKAEEAFAYFGVDTEGPEIVINVSGKSARNNEYFNSSRTATVTVTERNLGSGSDKIKINTQVGVPNTWSYSKGSSKSGNDDKWIKSFSYTADGDYTLAVNGTDALGHPAKAITYNGEYPKKFTIDKTKPVIRVTFNNNNVRNRKYYNANRTATVAIDEHNFDAKDVKVTSTISKGPRNRATSFPGISGFGSRGDRRTATIPFTKEGNFAFNVDFTDLAGNAASVVKVDEFVIDKTAPVVKIENVVNGGIYGGTVAPRAIFDDDNFSRNDSSFRFTGIRNTDAASLVPGFRSSGEYGGSYVMSDFPHVRRNDDVYTAYATSTDMAGNSTTVQVTFSVNRFGSSYDYNNDNATINLVSKEKGKYYTNDPQALQIREFNVNRIKSYNLTLDRGGNTIKLKEGKDYTVVKSDSDAGTTYVYKINKDIITEEGSYNIIVKSEDEAGNVNSNAAMRSEDKDYEVPLRFVYDTTAPTMSFQHYNTDGVIELKVDEKNKFRNMDVLDLGIKPEDDWALAAIRFVLTGKDGVIKDSGIIEGKEFWEVMGEDGVKKFLQEVPHGSSIKTLEVTVWDAAGNETTTTYKLSVTKNAAETAIANWYWILLALAAGGGGYAYYRHRRDDDDEEEDEDDAA